MEGIFRGRLNRAPYVGIVFRITLGFEILSWVAGFMIGAFNPGGGPELIQDAQAVGFLIGLVGAAICAPIVVKRLHDLNRPGTHYWLLLIPLYNIYLALVLMFQRGTPGDNQFGPDPLAKYQLAPSMPLG